MTSAGAMRHALLVLVSCAACWARVDRDLCEQQILATTLSPQPGPSLPAIPQTFEVHVMSQITDRNKTTEVTEYYDYPNNRGVVHQTESGNPFYVYYDYTNNEVLNIFPTNKLCMVTTLSTDENRFLFGYKAAGGRGYMFAPSGALHEGLDSLISGYMGSGVVRGIRVQTWYSCQYVAIFDATVNVYWSFSDPLNWDMAVGYPSNPIRCSVTGISRQSSDTRDNSTHPFSHTYDMVHFKPFISRQDVFETPDEVVCPGRVNVKPLPSVASSFAFTGENINSVNRQVSYVQEWYDYTMKVVKFRYVPTGALGNIYGGRPLTEIHDFGTGVAYIMDEKLGNCSVTPIERGMFDDVKDDITHVRLRTATQFFDLDNTGAVYMGQKTVRGLPCDVWVGIRADFPVPGTNSTAQWAFQTGNWTSTLSPSAGVPVQMHFHNSGLQYDFNIFHYDTSLPDVRHFDVTSCFTNKPRRNFDFVISNQFTSTVQTNMQDFTRAVLSTLVEVTQLSPLRCSNIRAVFLADGIHVRVTLLDKAPFVGDVNQVRAQPDLTTAANNLVSAIRNNAFIVTLSSGTKMAVLPDSVTEFLHGSTFPTTTPTTPSTTFPTTTPTTPSTTLTTTKPTTPSTTKPTTPSTTSMTRPATTRPATPAQHPATTSRQGWTSTTPSRIASSTPSRTASSTPGAMGGLGAGMLMLGSLLGTGSAVFYIRRKHASPML